MIRQAVVGQQRDDRDKRNERQVLEQQHGEGIAAGRRGEQITLGQHRQDDGGGGHGQARAQHGGALPRDAREVDRQHGEHRGGYHHLCGAEPEHCAAHHPQTLRPDFQANQEQQHHHAKAGDGADRVHAGDQTHPGRTDDDARHQIAQHAAEAGAPGQRDGDGGSGEQDDEGYQHQQSGRRCWAAAKRCASAV